MYKFTSMATIKELQQDYVGSRIVRCDANAQCLVGMVSEICRGYFVIRVKGMTNLKGMTIDEYCSNKNRELTFKLEDPHFINEKP